MFNQSVKSNMKKFYDDAQTYHKFILTYRPGKENVTAFTLSRTGSKCSYRIKIV